MRIDKYLKISKLIKRRTLAKKASDLQRVFVNDSIAKASKEVFVNDIIRLELGRNTIIAKIMSLNINDAELFEIIEIIPVKM